MSNLANSTHYSQGKAKAAFNPNSKITNINKEEDGSFTFDLDPDGHGTVYKYAYDGHGFKNLGRAQEDKKVPVRYPDGSVDVDGVWFDNEDRVKSYRGADALNGIRDANEQELNDRKRLEKILSERGQNEDLEHAIGTGYFGFGSLDELEKAHNNKYGLQSGGNVIEKKNPQETMEQGFMEDKIRDLMNYPEFDPDYVPEEEEKQASDLFGVDLSDKNEYDKLDKEPTIEVPSSVKVSQSSSSAPEGNLDEYEDEVDISGDDIMNFLKYHGIKTTPVEEEYIRNNSRIPQRLLNSLKFKGDYTEEDLYEDLIDFKR